MTPIYVVSQTTLQRWNRHTQRLHGIGGSEIAHVAMAEGLGELGYPVYSYIPLNEDEEEAVGNVEWLRCENFKAAYVEESPIHPVILINYRTPATFDIPKPAAHTWYFVAEDVDYTWTPEQLAKIDRYICLCNTHAQFTMAKYPELRGRVYISSNGIYSDRIAALDGKYPREPHRMFYASSPDRGLELILQQWWRIRERVSDATLYVAYGWENVDTIVAAFGPTDWRVEFKARLGPLLNQDGITWLGRLPQEKVWEQWQRASVFPAPHSFPETSGISFMEAQANGAFPVTNNHWAIVQNVQHGWKQDGIPQNDEMLRSIWLDNLYKALAGDSPDISQDQDPLDWQRHSMTKWARREFNWPRIVAQFDRWISEDSK